MNNRLSTVVEIWEYERGLLYEGGKFVKLLDPGRYRLWTWEHRHIHKMSLRQVSETISGQEVLTTDKVPVRVTLIAQYAISDPVLAAHSVEDYSTQLYQDLQLALRDMVSARSVDDLLADREALSGGLSAVVTPQAQLYGVTLHRVGVKDIVLPGSVQRVLLQEVEADRAGRAALVAARHETAAARARANTAKLLDENPLMIRLHELETLASLVNKQGNVLIIPGLETLLARSKPTDAPEGKR